MKRRWLRWTGLGLLSIVLLVAVLVMWTVNTQSGARWALSIAKNVTNDALQVRTVEGSLAGPLTLQGMQYVDPVSGLTLAADRIELDIAMSALFAARVHVVDAELNGIDVALGAPAEVQPEEDTGPFTLEAPIDIVVERFALRDASVRRDAETLIEIDSADFAGQWIGTAISVRELDVQLPQGEIRFAGDVRDEDVYLGGGTGRFRWRSGEREFAGTLEANAEANAVRLALSLTSPTRATLGVALQQREASPWTFDLAVPSFDPRDSLLPDSSWHALSAQLNGEGTLRQGLVQGEIVLNGEPIRFERLAFERGDDALKLLTDLSLGGGSLHANGMVQQNEEPVSAQMDVRWDDIVLSDQWVGQVLHTRGQLTFDGSAAAYQAAGDLTLGPPDRLADIELQIEGSPSSVTLQQFDIVQEGGRLAASGVVALEPNLGWQLDAKANGFDPGHFASAWGGDLSFSLASEGALSDAGPQATVVLQNLRGRLRGRPLSGHADIALATNKVISGDADLRSGESRLRLHGEPGDAMDATATIEVSALDDWIPNADGELRGRFAAQGAWPEMRIDGQARGSELHLAEMRAESLALNLDVTNPTQPQGSARIEVTNAAAAGMEFASLTASASGDAESHRLEVDASGSPLTTQLSLTGSLVDEEWSGTLAQLVLDVEDAARLTLQQPVQITYSKTQSRISEACFADGDIRLCFDGDMQSDGSMQASYSLRGVPLSLANAFVAADSSLTFDGAIQGEGQLARDSDGQLSGTLLVLSQGGRVAQQVEGGEESDVLLSFADLNLNATLEGDRARGRLAARLNDTGELRGALAASGLSQGPAQLDGSLAASLPSLAVIELFAPQLANVEGRADLNASVRGTLEAPDISGELHLAQLAAHVPELGVQLKEGRVVVSPRADGAFDIEGGIQSGDGQISFEGIARLEGMSTLTIDGKNFLAADIPGARVIIAPDLSLEHTAERVSIGGEITIPEATVNLQELPRGEGGGQKASSDVVIVDAKTQQETQAEAMPIYAEVSIVLGDEVDLSGFGLTAEVDGQLTVHERPGEPTRGSGEIRVAGTYKAYGQDLTIQEGRLLYANTPLDDPRLNVVATRQVSDVTAGLRATGSARNPQLTVFSDPEMGQANALSYLVAGKPIDEIGSGEGEGDAVQSAARSLGTAAGGLLAKNLGKRLGVDEFGIKDEEMIGGSAFTIGQYLSPRLYLSYGIGLFEPGEVVTLRYKLSDELAVQAQSGSEDSRAGIEYRMER